MKDPLKNLHKILIVFFAVSLSSSAHAQWEWLRNPEGVYVLSLEEHQGSLFTGTNAGGVYRSLDGQTWQIFKDSVFNRAAIDHIVSGKNGLYFGYSGGVYRFEDEKLDRIFTSYTTRVGVHDSLVFACSETGTFVTYNNGTSWTEITKFKNKTIRSITSSDTTVYFATSDSLYYSNDLLLWNRVKPQITGSISKSIVAEDSLYVAVYPAALYKTDRNGIGWRKIESPSLEVGSSVHDIILNGADVMVSTYSGIFLSQDNGLSWIKMDVGETLTFNTWFDDMAILGNKLFSGRSDGVYSTELGVNQLELGVDGFSNVWAEELYVDNDEIIMSNGDISRLYQSRDGGTTWQLRVYTGGTVQDIETIGDYKFFTYGRGVESYYDNGVSWQDRKQSLYDTTVYSLKYFNDTLYAASDYGLWASADSAKTWTSMNENIPIMSIKDVIVNDTAVFISTDQMGILWSNNRGDTWISLKDDNFLTNGAKIFLYNGKLFAGCNCQIPMVAYDFQQAKWENMNKGILYSPAAFLIYDNKLLIGTSGPDGGVFLFDDQKEEWNHIGQGMKSYYLGSLAITSDGILAGTHGYGLFRLPFDYFSPVTIPMDLQVDQITSAEATASWATVANAAGYRVFVSEDNFTTFVPGFDNLYVPVSSVKITGLDKTTLYSIKVLAENFGDTSDVSNVVEFTTLNAPPAKPSGLTAQQVSASDIELNWTDNADNETGFVIERWSSNISGYMTLPALDANINTYTSGGMETGTSYVFRVKATNEIGSSEYSNLSDTITMIGLPATPQNLSATIETISSLLLNWDGQSDASEFIIERAVGNGSFELLISLGGNNTSFLISGLDKVTYHYRIRARNIAGYSEYSNVLTMNMNIPVPVAPSDLTFTQLSENTLKLDWQDNADDEDGYVVERSVNLPANFVQIALLDENATTYTDSEYNITDNHYYRIYAFNIAGNSTFANGMLITGIDELAGKEVKVYPNPADQYFVVTLENAQPSLVRIMVVTGEIMSEAEVSSGEPIDIRGLSSGFYLVDVFQGTQVYRTKLIISKK